jgi:hypothetical protein
VSASTTTPRDHSNIGSLPKSTGQIENRDPKAGRNSGATVSFDFGLISRFSAFLIVLVVVATTVSGYIDLHIKLSTLHLNKARQCQCVARILHPRFSTRFITITPDHHFTIISSPSFLRYHPARPTSDRSFRKHVSVLFISSSYADYAAFLSSPSTNLIQRRTRSYSRPFRSEI